VGVDGHVLVADQQHLGQQGLRAVVAAPELVDGGQAVQHQGQLAAQPQGLGEVAGPAVGRLDLGRGEPAGGDQGQAEHDLGGQLGLVAVGALGEPRQGGQQELELLDGLAVGAAPQGLGGGRLEVADRPRVVVAAQELAGQLGRPLGASGP
jgi:hypothetical protein